MLAQIEDWLDGGRSITLATVIKTWGSSPRPAGAMMAITDQGEISGSVSGGCVESAVIDAAQDVFNKGTPIRLHFGVAHEEAWEVGLSCGGEIEVFLRPFIRDDLILWREANSRKERFLFALGIEGNQAYRGVNWLIFKSGSTLGIPSCPEPPPDLLVISEEFLASGKTDLIKLESKQIQEVFLQVVELPRELVLVGGVHIAIPLVSLAETVGFEVTVIDPRRLFSTGDRFPAVKRLLQEWPQDAFKQITLTESTAVVMLTHDPKIDDPAIKIALASPAFYIGALGSRKTHQKRVDRLLAQGIDRGSLDRIHAPVGLDLGASTPEEIALAVLAEIIQIWRKGKYVND